MPRLYDTFALAWETHGAPYSSVYDAGMSFHVTAPITLTGLRWYWRGGSFVTPTQLSLWRRGDSTRLGLISSVPAPTVTGWQDVALSASITLATGQVYSVVGRFPTSSGWPDRAGADKPTPPTPYVFETNFRTWQQSPASSLPSNTDAAWLVGVDVDTTPLAAPRSAAVVVA